MRYRLYYLRRKKLKTKKKKIPTALYGIICVVIGGSISAFTSFGNTYFSNILKQEENKDIEYYGILNNIANLETIISEEFYIFMSMRESLSGHELYGNNFIEEYRNSGKNPAAFTAIKRKEVFTIQSKLERWFPEGKLSRITMLLNSFMGIEDLFIAAFIDHQGWKSEPLPQNMLMNIYQTQIDTGIQQLYKEVKALYAKN